jgi:hypothetical protein
MISFGIISEGRTDQIVIDAILHGYFHPKDLTVNYVQPSPILSETPAGWGHVFNCLKNLDAEGTLQYNNYLVIQIDADKQDDYGVPSQALSDIDRVLNIIEKLKNSINKDFYTANQNRFIFAVALDTIECWILPLLYIDDRSQKTTGCLESANRALRKSGNNGLSAGDKMFPRSFVDVTRDYRKKRILIQHHDKNISLKYFISQLEVIDKNTNPVQVENI